ncbi:hypothetical protein PsYK624_158080 [Phanerochaete sordida]|uniref:BTB domain-containing protein n=1 Tax=Phanerochaete sordida TaxID=48140 RepID=A0A9P3GRK5_9APHY|nr:hypothetical protein PsYK624_158080 [Phanerochaete sordida]
MAYLPNTFGPRPLDEITESHDVVLVANDKTTFPATSKILCFGSPVFAGVLTGLGATFLRYSLVDGRPILDMPYPPSVVHDLLTFFYPGLPSLCIQPENTIERLMLVDAARKFKVVGFDRDGGFLTRYFGSCASDRPLDAYALAVTLNWEAGMRIAAEASMRLSLHAVVSDLPKSLFFTDFVKQSDDGRLVTLRSARADAMEALLTIEDAVGLPWLEKREPAFAFMQCKHQGSTENIPVGAAGAHAKAPSWFLGLCSQLRDALRTSSVPETISEFQITKKLESQFCERCGRRTKGDLTRFFRRLADAARAVVVKFQLDVVFPDHIEMLRAEMEDIKIF